MKNDSSLNLTYWVVHPVDGENDDAKLTKAVEISGNFFLGNFTFVILTDFEEVGEKAGVINNDITAWLSGGENDHNDTKSRYSLCGVMDLMKPEIFSLKNESRLKRPHRRWMRIRARCLENSTGRSILVVHERKMNEQKNIS